MIDADLVTRIHRRLVEDGGDLRLAGEMLDAEAPLLTPDQRAEFARQIAARFSGFGAIDHLLHDPEVSEVMLNGVGPVWVERDGEVELTEVRIDADELQLLVERILAPIGRRLDPLRPWVDGRLVDGSRVNIVGPPIAPDGPCVTIRRFVVRRPTLAEFASPGVVEVLRHHVSDGATILVSGGTGAGKTTLLNALAGELPDETRVVTVEDAAELALPLANVVRLECRPPGLEGTGQVETRDLVRVALRLRPDRLLVGEVRGAEAFDLMQALNTGHRGGMSTIHANSPVDALDRLLGLVLSADAGVPASVVESQLARAIDLVVQVARATGGSRRITDVARVTGPGTVESLGVMA
ncbi:MAG: ATPase, T2SS/T4P/T4SS family [Acidimicrobiales bacterium]